MAPTVTSWSSNDLITGFTSDWSNVNSNIANTFVFNDEPLDTGP